MRPTLKPNPGSRLPGLRGRRHRSRGQSLVEFALILPVFLVLFAATLDLGRIAFAQIAVINAAREGAFQASLTPAAFISGTGCTSANQNQNTVMCRVQLEAQSGTVVSIQPADVALSCSPSSCASGIGNTTTVKVTGHFQLLTPLMAAFFGGSTNIAFSASSTAQVATVPSPPPAASATPTPTPTPAPPTPTPTPTPAPTCGTPSAGFSYVVTPAPPNNHVPVTVTVTDTSTSPGCAITGWTWQWDVGVYSYGPNPGPHTYYAKGSYDISLTVTNSTGNATSGVVTIVVKP